MLLLKMVALGTYVQGQNRAYVTGLFIKCRRTYNIMAIRQVEVNLYHQDCTVSKVSEKFPELTFDTLSGVMNLQKRERGVSYQVIWKISGESESQLEACIEHIKMLPETLFFEVLSREKGSATVILRNKTGNSSYEGALKHDAVYYRTPSIHGGYENHNLLVLNPKNTSETLRELEEVGELHIKRIGRFRVGKDEGVKLSEKQRGALEAALKHKYYEWPREVTLEEIAISEKVSRRALQERLRRAEAKLIPKLLGEYLAADRGKRL